MPKQKKTKLRLLGWDRLRENTKDIEKDEDRTPTLKFFFILLKRRFTDLLSLNFLMLLQIVPILVAIYVYLSRNTTPMSSSVLYPILSGAETASSSVSLSFWNTLFNIQTTMTAYHSSAYIVIPIMVLITFVTFGWQNVGASYILRGMVRCDPVSLIDDYFYAIKKNFRQGLFLGMIDFVILFFLGYDIFYFYAGMNSFFSEVAFVLICVMAVVYLIMRFYLYQLLVTFDLKNKKILKNAFIFAILGIKRNLMAILGFAVLIGLNFIILMALMQINIAIGLVLPLFYIMAFPAFITSYASYPIIKRYMIDPYYNEDGSPKEPKTES